MTDESNRPILASGTSSSDGPPRVLPRWLARFIGREQELAEIATLLADPERRLLTLTGPGGVGKTRLAVRIASDREAHYPDGTWFVPLSLSHDAHGVPATLARTLGIHQAAAQPTEAILEALHPVHGLLILDNFEHVLPAASLVSDLLAACPTLVLLITSRAPLDISGEHVYHVPPLALPAIDGATTVESIIASEAVSLFLHRSREHGEDLPLTPRNAEAIASICRSLDGLPLAIELAASWLRVLPPRAILERLHHRLDLLESSPRDAPARQRTMRATIDWSYVLLPSGGQALLRHLSVFAGGAPMDGIRAVVGGTPEDDTTLLGQLNVLMHHSLLRKMPVLPGHPDWDPPRFLLMSTIRDFAFEQLDRAGEAAALRDRHARWCMTLAEAAEHDRIGLGHTGAAERLVAERHNLHAAIDWLGQRDDIAHALPLVTTLWPLWLEHGEIPEGRAHLERLLAHPEATRDRATWARGKVVLGTLLQAQGEPAAEEVIEEARAEPALRDDPRAMGVASTTLGLVEMVRGNATAATQHLEDALTLFTAAGDLRAGSWALRHLSSVAYRQGNIDAYERRAAEGLRIVGPDGHPRDLARLGASLAQAAARRGHLADATVQFELVLAQYREANDQWGEADALQRLGHLAWLRDDPDHAARFFEESALLLRRIGDPEGMSRVLIGQGWLARRGGDPDLAGRRFAEATILAGHHDANRPLARAMLGTGVIALDQGRPSAAATSWRRSLELTVELGDPLATIDVLEWCAHLGRGHLAEAAAELIGTAAAHRRATGIPVAAPLVADHDRLGDHLRAHLGDRRFRAAMALGAEASLEDAIATASRILSQASRSQGVVPGLAQAPSAEAQDTLSRREIDVLRLLALGHSDQEMANALFISRRTVASHVAHIYNKIGVSSRAAAAAWAVRHGIA